MTALARLPFVHRLLASALAGCLALSAVPARAAESAPAEATPAKSAKAPAAVSGTVALLRFDGPSAASDMRSGLKDALSAAGFTVKSVALDAKGAAKKAKCRGGEMDEACLERLGKWLNKSSKTAADFVAFGGVVPGEPAPKARIVLYDVGQGKTVQVVEGVLDGDDLILPIVMPRAAAAALAHHLVPPVPTPEEEKILATLDEPEKTAEEIEAEKRKIAEAEAQAGQVGAGDVDVSGIRYDLKADFKDYCRNGPRKKRESRDEDIDPRPSCKMGPFWGYWQPRAWAFLTLTAAGLVTTGVMYGLALGARKPYKDAVSAVQDYEAMVGGDPSRNPNLACSGGTCYQDLALDVAKNGARMRKFALGGDVALGVTVLLAGVLGIIIYQDRKYAREKLTEEKRLRALSGIRVAPALGKGFAGGMLGFRF